MERIHIDTGRWKKRNYLPSKPCADLGASQLGMCGDLLRDRKTRLAEIVPEVVAQRFRDFADPESQLFRPQG